MREREKRRIGSLGDQQVTRDAGVGQPAINPIIIIQKKINKCIFPSHLYRGNRKTDNTTIRAIKFPNFPG